MPVTYYTTLYSIYWDEKPKTYRFYISRNCDYQLSAGYQEESNIYYYNQSNSLFPPSQCNDWTEIPYYYFNEFIEHSQAWVCGYMMCDNPDIYLNEEVDTITGTFGTSTIKDICYYTYNNLKPNPYVRASCHSLSALFLQ